MPGRIEVRLDDEHRRKLVLKEDPAVGAPAMGAVVGLRRAGNLDAGDSRGGVAIAAASHVVL